jgi:hypothetical protein
MIEPDVFDGPVFPSDLKCCTFMPGLPNFQVGALLADPDPGLDHGRAEVRERIRAGNAVSPIGVMKPSVYTKLYGRGGFGQSTALRCPYYRDGGCGVWSHREAVCSTWFCKHDRGLVGWTFWQNAMWTLLTLEQAVAAKVAIELGIPEEAVNGLTPSELSREENLEYYEGVWADWVGREEAFFVAASERVDRLDWEEAARWAKLEESNLTSSLRRSYAAFVEPVPDVVALGRLERIGENATIVRLRSYSGFNPVELPRAAADALPGYEGRPTVELAEIGLDAAMVRRLADHEILLPTVASERTNK